MKYKNKKIDLKLLIIKLKPLLIIGFGSYFKTFKKKPKDIDILIIANIFKNLSLCQRINLCRENMKESDQIDFFPWSLDEFKEFHNGLFIKSILNNKYKILYEKSKSR